VAGALRYNDVTANQLSRFSVDNEKYVTYHNIGHTTTYKIPNPEPKTLIPEPPHPLKEALILAYTSSHSLTVEQNTRTLSAAASIATAAALSTATLSD
jgi:hypothetical protein